MPQSIHSKIESPEHWDHAQSQGSTNGASRGPPGHIIQRQPFPEENGFQQSTGSKFLDLVSRVRIFSREYAGEFFGTMMLVLFGCGANCQYVLSQNQSVSPLPAGTWASFCLGWGTGITLGVWLTGGHINPAVTLAFAVWRDFPWRKVPGYMFCQLLGGVVGAAIVYGQYIHAIDIVEGGRHIRTLKTAGLFGTVPLEYLSNISCFFNEFLTTAILLIGLLTLKDPRNQLSAGVIGIGFFIVFVGIVASFGMQTGFAMNPARDLGPRMFSSMVGYGRQVWTLRNQYWLWCPCLATFTGALVGTMIYDVFMDTGNESIINRLLASHRLRQQEKNDADTPTVQGTLRDA